MNIVFAHISGSLQGSRDISANEVAALFIVSACCLEEFMDVFSMFITL